MHLNAEFGGAADVGANEALLVEALLLRALRHAHVVKVVAVISQTAPIVLCTELMENGDLRSFLRACRPTAVDPPAKITATDLVVMAARLASAMAYLEKNGVIHRDIAARNGLVGTNSVDVQLADLGAARNVFKNAERVYIATSDHNPSRWLPLEAITEVRFSHKSDVFGFGVLLWELFSYGRTPWGAFGVADMVDALRAGERLQKPGLLPGEAEDRIYSTALRCWHELPAKRPPFRQLNDELLVLSKALVASRGGGSTKPASTTTAAQEQGEATTAPALDEEGYMHDAPLVQTASIDEEGYVEEGYVQVSATVQTDTSTFDSPVAETSFQGGNQSSTNAGSFRARAGSVYDGFDACPDATEPPQDPLQRRQTVWKPKPDTVLGTWHQVYMSESTAAPSEQ
jgi:serine/threonine protein kinase